MTEAQAVPTLPKIVMFTVVEKTKGILTKTYSINKDSGKLEKDSSSCVLYDGKISTEVIEFRDLVDVLKNLSTSQALIHGINPKAPCRIVSQKLAKKMAGDEEFTTRLKKNFIYPDEGLLMFDYDPLPGETPLTKQELITSIRKLHPELQKAALIWRPSASSCIVNKETDEVYAGVKNQRIYMPYCNGDNLQNFITNLERLSWAAGQGYIMISAAGTALTRCLFDTAVFSPERLDFAAGGEMTGDLVQRLPNPQYTDGNYVNLDNMGDVVPDAKFNSLINQAKTRIRKKLNKARKVYVKQQADKLVKSQGLTPAKAAKVVKSRLSYKLLPGDVLFTDDWSEILVIDLITNPEDYANVVIRDPMEPDYGSSKAKIFVDEDGAVTVNSFAHGGRVFSIHYDSETYINWLSQFSKENLPDVWLDRVDKMTGATEVEAQVVVKYVAETTGIAKGALTKDWKETVRDARYKEKNMSDPTSAEGADMLTHHQLAELVIADYPKDLVATEGRIFYYNGACVWNSKSLSKVEIDIVTSYDGAAKCCRKSDYKAIAQHVYTLKEVVDFFADAPIGLATPDYFWELRGKEIIPMPHDPKHRVRFMLPFNMAQDAEYQEPVATLAFLNWAFEHDKSQVDLIQEIIGAIIFGQLNYTYQKAVLLRGSGSNGKGVVMSLLKALIPAQYISEVEPRMFSNPLYVAMLASKLVNVIGELDKNRFARSSDFKKIVDSSDLVGKPLYHAPYKFPSIASHIFSSNYPLVTNDDSPGMKRRWLYLDFKNTIHDGDKIPHLGKMLVQDEGDRILRWATEGLLRLVSNNGAFTQTKSSIKMQKETFGSADSVNSFLADTDIIVEDANGLTSRPNLYNIYREWASNAGFVPKEIYKKMNFNSKLEEEGFDIKKVKGSFYWIGLKLTRS